MITEEQMLDRFSEGYDFPPASFRLSRLALQRADLQIDALVEATVDGQTFEFEAEFRSRNSPKVFEETLLRIESTKTPDSRLPLLVVPYLRESQLKTLQERKLSGLDLSGNGVITVPGRILIFRSGSPNKFPDSAPSKYAYRGATSLVARVFLCRSSFTGLSDIAGEIEKRGATVALSTISKALKRLESDLMIEREPDSIRLLQPDKLLENLAKSYVAPKETQSTTLSAKVSLDELFSASSGISSMVFTGQTSIKAYAVMGTTDIPKLYVQSIGQLLVKWGNSVEKSTRFIDLQLVQTDDPTVYFDSRLKGILPYASPVQAYLEASSGDKREQETAMELKAYILSEISSR